MFDITHLAVHGNYVAILSEGLEKIIKINLFSLNNLFNNNNNNYYYYYYYYYYSFRKPDIGIMVRVFANGLGNLGSIPGRVIPKTLEMVLDASLLNTQHYKERIKGKVEKSRERSSALPQHLSVVAIEKGAFRSPSIMVANFTYLLFLASFSHQH